MLFANEQYSGRECLKISGTPTRVKEKLTSLEKTLEEIDAPVESGLEIDCHYLPFKGHPKKVITRLNSHKDPSKLFLNK